MPICRTTRTTCARCMHLSKRPAPTWCRAIARTRAGTAVGRGFRRWLLGDTIRDTGCSLRLFKREIGLQLPLTLKGMHRFIPVTARHLGYRVVEMGVNHRARVAGETKYGMGITKR